MCSFTDTGRLAQIRTKKEHKLARRRWKETRGISEKDLLIPSGPIVENYLSRFGVHEGK